MSRFDKFHVHDLLIGVYLHGRCWVAILRHPGLNHPRNASGNSLRLKFKYMVDRNPDLIHFTPEHRNEAVAREMLIEEAQNLGRLNRLRKLIGIKGDVGMITEKLLEIRNSVNSQTEQLLEIRNSMKEIRNSMESQSERLSEVLNKITIFKCMVETKKNEEEENVMD